MRTALMVVALFASFVSGISQSSHAQTRSKKHPLPPLPYGQTGPLPQIPLDSMPPEPPQVKYQDGELTIIALNSTLADILRCIHERTTAEIEIPAVTERVVTRLGPGPVNEILSELLNGSHFNYVLLGSPGDPTRVTRVVLQAKTQPDAQTPVRAGATRTLPPVQPGRIIANNTSVADQSGLGNQADVPTVPEVAPPLPNDPVDNSD